ncbi:hypothetical protein [Streptomyces axinellae]|uniref:Uncharacterized protein n=1 Tax=Streptomyces axinellae TaxID=552788 RepID=A0ABN3PX38_9ACTN
MKPLLWAVLVAAVAFNVSTSLLFDGAQQALLSVASGVVSLACAGGLYALRDRRSHV